VWEVLLYISCFAKAFFYVQSRFDKGVLMGQRSRSLFLASAIFLFSLCIHPLVAASLPVEKISPRVSNVALLFPAQEVRPGSELEGTIQFFLDPGWHVYWKNPGEIGLGPSFDWSLPPGVTVKELSWPAPTRFKRGGTIFYGYEGKPEWVVTLAIDPSVPSGTYPITLSAFWISCDGTCVPASQQFETSLTVSPAAPQPSQSQMVREAKALLPIQLSGGEATIRRDELIVRLPIPKLEDVQSAVLFPEHSGLFAVEQTSMWEWKDGEMVLSIPSLDTAKETLTKAKRFIGLCQLITPSKTVTYSFDVPYESQSRLTFQEPSWQQVNVSEEMSSAAPGNTLYFTLLLAVAGGFLLNFTPCVLPVVGLKVLTLLSLREARLLKLLPHGLIYTLGVLVTFWTLAGTLYLFESFGTTMGWGFQLQEPHFVMALTILLFCLALNLFGLFEIGTSVAAWASEIEYQKGLSSQAPTLRATFISGVLATLIATPCTGPLLGSVFGFASTFRPIEGLQLFTAVGFGMSLPLLIITACPPLIRLLPRAGAWEVGLKQFFGFCVLATIAWLLWVLSDEIPSMSFVAVFSGLLLIAFGLWIFGRWGTPVRSKFTRAVGRACTLLFVAAGVLVLAASIDQRVVRWISAVIPERPTIQWQPYSKSLRDEEVEKGNTVFVAFSARWCLTCQTNKLAFLSARVAESFKAHHIVAMMADWTNGDPEITAELRALGRNGVPVYVLYKQGRPPFLLPELATPDSIVQSVETMAEEPFTQ
jgi:thiol:disulfide interchange protein